MTFGTAMSNWIRGIFTFKGRASRPEFWWPLLVYLLVFVAWVLAGIGSSTTVMVLSFLALAFTGLMPVLMTSVAVRRMHDIGFSATLPLMATGAYLVLFAIQMTYLSAFLTNRQNGIFGVDPAWSEKFDFLVQAGMITAAIWAAFSIAIMVAALKQSSSETNAYGPPPDGLSDTEIFA